MESHVQAVFGGKTPAEALDSCNLGWLGGSDVKESTHTNPQHMIGEYLLQPGTQACPLSAHNSQQYPAHKTLTLSKNKSWF